MQAVNLEVALFYTGDQEEVARLRKEVAKLRKQAGSFARKARDAEHSRQALARQVMNLQRLLDIERGRSSK